MAASDVRPLENVIMRVDKEGAPEPGVSYHRISPNSGDRKRSLLRGWGAHIYRVQSISAGRSEAIGESTTLTARGQSGEHSVDLAIRYRALCPDGQEEEVVRRLGRHGDPSGELNKIITATARELLWEQGDMLFDDLVAAKKSIVTEVTKAVTAETGLWIQAEVAIKNEEKLENVAISRRIQVQFVDLRGKVFGVHLDADITVDPRKALVALATVSTIDTLEARILDFVDQFFKKNVVAQTIVDGFRAQSVQAELIESLTAWLEPEGRRVSGLELRVADDTPLPESDIKLELQAEHKKLRAKPIRLQSDLILHLDSLGTFLNSPVSEIKSWAQSKFQAIVDRQCLKKRRIDFLNDERWSIIKDAIRCEMEVEASKIGYEITQIVSEPQIPEREFCAPRNHRLNIEGLALRSSSDERVRVTVDANFYISQWNDPDLSRKIEQDLDLEEDLEREIHDALTTVLVGASPDWFFLRFNLPETDTEGPSLQEMLIEAVEVRLREAFKAEVTQVSVNGVDNSDVQIVKNMLLGVQSRDFIVESNELQGQPIEYSVHLRVTGLSEDEWHRIINSVRNPEALIASIEELLQGELKLLPDNILRFTDHEGRDFILGIMESRVAKKIEASFGLKVSFHNVVRDKSELERKIGEMKKAVIARDVEDKIAQLNHESDRRQKLRKAEQEDIDSQIEDRRQIRDTRRSLTNDPENMRRAISKDQIDALDKREAALTTLSHDFKMTNDKQYGHLNENEILHDFYGKANLPKIDHESKEKSTRDDGVANPDED